ncbi:flavodoxin [Bacillus sp. JJ1764]|uniref:flavodoxin n=1 Tax=Bacillus sp. JJ1764 TaxID=3122964 RepID=UPI002FFFD0D1
MKAKILIVYASMTGNTEEMAHLIGDGVIQAGAVLVRKDIIEVSAADLQSYDGILIGAYTWGDGDLPDEFLDFYEEMDPLHLSGKKTAVFGSCSSSYEHRGRAVDLLIEKLTEIGADIILKGLKIDLAPSSEEKKLCIQYGRSFVEKSFGLIGTVTP